MHSLVYQDNSDHFCHFSGQLNISGQIQDINEISGISEQLGPLLTTKSTKEKDKLCTYSVPYKANHAEVKNSVNLNANVIKSR